MMKFLFTLSFTISLAGCGTNTVQTIVNTVPVLSELNEVSVPNDTGLVEELAHSKRTTIRVARLNTAGSGDFTSFSNVGEYTTFTTPSGQSLTLFNGIVTSTKGFGDDLVGLASNNYDLRSVGEVFTRSHKVLDGEDQVTSVVFRCVRERTENQVIFETCSNQTMEYENQYNIGAKPISSSRQWITPEIGYIEIN